MDCLTYFKTRMPTDAELYALEPLVLTQEGVPWRPRHADFQAPVNDAFNKEVIAAARADADAESNNFASYNTKVQKCSLRSPVSANPREQGEIQQVLSDSNSSSAFKDISLLTSPVTSNLTASPTSQE